jgi:hypothetical protein
MCCDRHWSLPNASTSSVLGRLPFVTILARLGLRSTSPIPGLCERASRELEMGSCTRVREHVQDIRILSLWNPSELSYLAVRYLAEEGVDLVAGCGSRGRLAEP